MIRKAIKKIQYTYQCHMNRVIAKSFASCGAGFSIGQCCVVKGAEYISIGNSFNAGAFLKLQAWDSYQGKRVSYSPAIKIGNSVSIMDNCQISCINAIEIGDGCLLGDNVFITDNFHGEGRSKELLIEPIKRNLASKGGVKIGTNVWIGRNVCIMPGVSIGDGCIIAANAVVTHSIPSNTIAGGVPAKLIRQMDVKYESKID